MHLDERRDTGAGTPMRRASALGGDLRQAVRSVRRAPWYAATLAAVVAVGIALAATVFALVDGVLFKPLPYRAPQELYAIQGRAGGEAIAHSSVSLREVEAFRRAVPDAIFTAHSTSTGYGTLGVINGPTVWLRRIDRHFWSALGVRPLLGGFEPADFQTETATPPVVITYGLWQRVFGADPDVIGRRVDIMRTAIRVAGVLPREFVFPSGEGQARPDMLAPAMARPTDGGGGRYHDVIARLPSHVPIAAVRARLEAAAREAGPAGPDAAGRHRPFDTIEILPLKQVMTSDERTASRLAFGAVTLLVMLIAVNVGGLAGSHSLDRARESAARRALGASSFDLVRLQFLETGLLVLAGSIAGLGLAQLLLVETARRLPEDILLLREPVLDGRVIAAVVAAAVFVAIAATVAGVRTSQRRSLTSLLGQGAGTTVEPARSGGRAVLQAGQVALAMLLVTGGALFLASLQNVWRADTGYDLADTLYIDVRVGGLPGTATPLVRTLELLDEVRRVPGVSSAGVIDTLLLAGARRGSVFSPPNPDAPDDAEMIPVSSQFFALAGLHAVDGRLPTDAELDAGAPVAVVSARTARDFWPGRSAVGQMLSSKRATLSVIGVVPDARFQDLDRASYGEIYVPIRLGLWTGLAPTYLIRATLPERQVMPALLETIRRFDPTASIRRAQSVSLALAESIRQRRFHAWLFGGLGVASLLVAAAGILGLVAMTTARRTREMGVRLALGATPDGLRRLLLREQLGPVAAGVVAGGAAAAWAVRFIGSFLYELSAYDVRVWAIAAGVVLVAAAAGTLVPASRLGRIDPVAALRAD
jgi:putative ABC transport system permease protein